MKDALLRLPSLFVALVMLAAGSGTANADEGADFLSQLHNFRVNNYVALDAYYRFSSSGDIDVLNEIVAATNAADGSMSALADSTAGILTKEEVDGLTQAFRTFRDLMRQNINDVRKTGYPDLRLVSEMAEQATTMNEMASDLYANSLESDQVSANQRVEAARSAAVTLAQMMAKYSARSNLAASQTFQGTATDRPLDEKAKELDAFLAEIRRGQSSPELKQAIENINSKWEFIRSSYINFNENNVSYVIGRYSHGILDGLTSVITMLQEQA